ncbi:nucleoside diphosphate kinase, mitochondrial isoform X1 [Boleophthalmus pectinirostris]|uniref:nucleoside diphosphate kinase, mitochondrial isoform X1 n=1 Tax=Boleophthalmus pectinirostris TaxID=150288 RepID=UPI00242C98BA|nr:nucleoside diphosphate kinase, mitochondrial isoform X1 [Boleophthalmus pectinirostris]
MSVFQRCVFQRLLQQVSSGASAATGLAPASTQSALWRGRVTTGAGHRNKSSGPCVKERTFIAVKPDGVQRRLIGQIIHRFERRGFKLVGMKLLQVSKDLLSEHYCQLTKKPFYPDLVDYMTSGPVVAMVWEGPDIVKTSRMMVGHTNPAEAHAGTIRADFSFHISRNVVHASDSTEGAQREIQLWFDGKDLLNWDCIDQSVTSEL